MSSPRKTPPAEKPLFRTAFVTTAMLTAALMAPNAVSAAESRSYVVNWFTEAMYYGGDGVDSECPNGTNLSAIDFYRRDLLKIGHSPEKVEAALKDFPGEGGLGQPWVPLVMVRGNGKDNVYAFPETMSDPEFITASGKYGFGFNLDGKRNENDFEDPETGERGIDNQLFRVMGCTRTFRGMPAPARPAQPETNWDVLRNLTTAWIITVTAENGFDRDGPVEVKFNRALQRVTRDATGWNVQPDMTYGLDPDPRTQTVLQGRLKEGMITTEQKDVTIIGDEYVMAEFDFSDARVRLEVERDGTLSGVIGGFMSWYPYYYRFAKQAYITEYAASVDVPGMYHALKKMADYDPDPETGQNRKISAAYRIDAVPAFTMPAQTADASAQ